MAAGKRRPKRKNHIPHVDRDSRAKAKALLRTGGEAILAGNREAAREHFEQALEADPTFVEPAIELSYFHDEDGNDAVADALVEEAVRRGAAAVDRLPPRPNGAHWWRDEATRPYMKALVARGWRLLSREDPVGAAQQFRKVFDMEPDEDPLQAGVYAAECLMWAGEFHAAIDLYEELNEGSAVCYGRGHAFIASGKLFEGLTSLWLGILLNAGVVVGLVGEDALTGIDRDLLCIDEEETLEILGRIRDLFDAGTLHILEGMLADSEFQTELRAWGPIARAYDQAEGAADSRHALREVEDFLSVDRIERDALKLLERLPRVSPPHAGSRLPII